MSNEFMREEHYIVFKMSDLGNSLKGDEIRRLAREYAEHLEQLGKKPLDYVVIAADWPEYESTWRIIEARVTGAQQAPSVPEGFSREDLEAVADGLDGYEKTVNVGNVTGGGDDHLESTTAYAARFIRAMLAAPEAKP